MPENVTIMDTDRILGGAKKIWSDDILPTLRKFITIPNLSPAFDKDGWQKNMDQAARLLATWCVKQIPHLPMKCLDIEVIELEGKTPLLYVEIQGTSETAQGTVLFYGHMDKQPAGEDWREGLDAFTPVQEGDLLYGRGSSDDGYPVFAVLAALRILAELGIPFARCIILIEAAEESGSPDFQHHLDYLANRLGFVNLIIALDSTCGDYKRFWQTTSFRGYAGGDLTTKILTRGIHSGANGIVPDVDRIERYLLGSIVDNFTGEILLPQLKVPIPQNRVEEARNAGEILGEKLLQGRYPWATGAHAMDESRVKHILNVTWRTSMTKIGHRGIPLLKEAGGVLRAEQTSKLEFRIPPTLNPALAFAAIKNKFEVEIVPPNGARVLFEGGTLAEGWNAKPLAPWLEKSIDAASIAYFGNPMAAMGEGGCIPLMTLLGKTFPQAQLIATGLLGPNSNAHGPDENLNLRAAESMTACLAQILADHANNA